ncbi:MAG: ammonia-forming cytochrome c nitrite reductase subunit c552 [Candidatus Thorarchaeota archaeon]
MTDQEEILVRQSRWSGRRVVLLYWFSVVFVGTAAAAGIGATVLNQGYSIDQTNPHTGITEPWHPSDCSPCHDDKIASWNQTLHWNASTYLNSTHVLVWGTIPTSIVAFNGSCSHCMATRWNETDLTYWDLGVACAACHEAPGVAPTSSTSCDMTCHTPKGVYQSDNSAAAHSNSLDDLLANAHAQDFCLHCMAGQGLFADPEDLTLDNTELSNIFCATCHNPHDSTNEDQLRRASVTELCGECHSDSGEFLTDTSDWRTTSPHNELDCTDCHGSQFVPAHNSSRGWVEAAYTLNHSWALDVPDACERCHIGENVTQEATLTTIQADIGELMDKVEDEIANATGKADEAKNVTGVDQAKVNNSYDLIAEAEDLYDAVEGDNSMGFHNPNLAEEKLLLALAKLEEAYETAADAIDAATPAGTPGFELLGILLAFGLLGLSVLIRRRKR